MHRPTLSVFTANYNHARFLSSAIESVVTQSRLPDEYLILDDGSTDNSVEIMEKYAKKYPFIRLLNNGRNLGVGKSVNRLFREAKGDFLYGAGADDLVLPGFFEKAMAMAEKYPQAGILFGTIEHLYENGRIFKQGFSQWKTELYAPPDKFLKEVLLVERPFFTNSQAAISKRELILELGGYNEKLQAFADAFLVRAIALKNGVCYIPQSGMRFRVRDESYCHRIYFQRPFLIMKIIFAYVALMKSPKFHQIFPKEYVIDFEIKAPLDVIRAQVRRVLLPTGIPRVYSFLRGK